MPGFAPKKPEEFNTKTASAYTKAAMPLHEAGSACHKARRSPCEESRIARLGALFVMPQAAL
jgi:hypothetical protein